MAQAGSKAFFFEKRKQKAFAGLSRTGHGVRAWS
jgi:hypothetical protein